MKSGHTTIIVLLLIINSTSANTATTNTISLSDPWPVTHYSATESTTTKTNHGSTQKNATVHDIPGISTLLFTRKGCEIVGNDACSAGQPSGSCYAAGLVQKTTQYNKYKAGATST